MSEFVGQKIKKFRNRAGISQLELEMRIETSPGSISRIESGEVNPSKETLLKISNALDLKSYETLSLYDLDFTEIPRLLNLAKELAFNIEDFDKTMQKTIDLMSSEMDYIGGVIFIYQEDINALVPWFHTNSKLVNFMATFLSRKFRDYIYLLNRSDSVIVDSFNQNELVVGEGMTTLRPIVEKRYTDFVTRYIKAKSCLSIPLYLNDQGVGLLWVTTARDKILEEEIQIMKSMSDYLAINIFNSLKFKTLKDKEQKF